LLAGWLQRYEWVGRASVVFLMRGSSKHRRRSGISIQFSPDAALSHARRRIQSTPGLSAMSLHTGWLGVNGTAWGLRPDFNFDLYYNAWDKHVYCSFLPAHVHIAVGSRSCPTCRGRSFLFLECAQGNDSVTPALIGHFESSLLSRARERDLDIVPKNASTCIKSLLAILGNRRLG
jgi:hypothetical protein